MKNQIWYSDSDYCISKNGKWKIEKIVGTQYLLDGRGRSIRKTIFPLTKNFGKPTEITIGEFKTRADAKEVANLIESKELLTRRLFLKDNEENNNIKAGS